MHKELYLFLEREHIISEPLDKIETPRGAKHLPISISIEEVKTLGCTKYK